MNQGQKRRGQRSPLRHGRSFFRKRGQPEHVARSPRDNPNSPVPRVGHGGLSWARRYPSFIGSSNKSRRQRIEGVIADGSADSSRKQPCYANRLLANMNLSDPPVRSPLADSTTVVCPSDVLARFFEEGDAVLLHLGTGTYFGANEVAAFALKSMASAITVGQLEDAIAARYEAPRDRIRADLEELLGHLLERRLVHVASSE